jgi:hypothetical protein
MYFVDEHGPFGTTPYEASFEKFDAALDYARQMADEDAVREDGSVVAVRVGAPLKGRLVFRPSHAGQEVYLPVLCEDEEDVGDLDRTVRFLDSAAKCGCCRPSFVADDGALLSFHPGDPTGPRWSFRAVSRIPQAFIDLAAERLDVDEEFVDAIPLGRAEDVLGGDIVIRHEDLVLVTHGYPDRDDKTGEPAWLYPSSWRIVRLADD